MEDSPFENPTVDRYEIDLENDILLVNFILVSTFIYILFGIFLEYCFPNYIW